MASLLDRRATEPAGDVFSPEPKPPPSLPRRRLTPLSNVRRRACLSIRTELQGSGRAGQPRWRLPRMGISIGRRRPHSSSGSSSWSNDHPLPGLSEQALVRRTSTIRLSRLSKKKPRAHLPEATHLSSVSPTVWSSLPLCRAARAHLHQRMSAVDCKRSAAAL
jgi:hypothetical protein